MKTSKYHAGFTLIELMVVVAVIALLASIAVPSYQRYVIKSRRAAASACLMELAQFAERHRTTTMSYAGLTAAMLPTTQCRTDLDGHYTFGFAGTPSAAAFTLQATPQGTQAAKDTDCGTLGVDQKGSKSASGGGENCF